ncbi:MAG: tRNA (guanosine(46)-N7)-methyltransferase TrmB, partial [Paraburkholderia sp.]
MIHDPNQAGQPDALPQTADDANHEPSITREDLSEDVSAGEATEANDSKEALRLRRIRSFVTRAGRVSTGQRRAMDELGPRFVLPYTPQQPDWNAVFGRDAARILEIGFGMGATTAEIAAHRPNDDFLGVEVHEPGVGALLK